MNAFRDLYWQSHDRLRLYARIYDAPDPAAPSVLCLPGLRRNSRDFEDLAPRLQNRFRVIAPDLRGRGSSARDRFASNYQPNNYVHDLLKLLNTLNCSRVSVIGTAYGGIIGMMLARAQPSVVSGLVLNDIGPQVTQSGRNRWLLQLAPQGPPADWVEAVQRQKALYGEAWPGLPAERWARLTRRLYREDSYGRVVMDCDAVVATVERQWPASDADLWPLWSELRELPIQVIHGALSDILSTETLARMAAEHPGLRQVRLEDRGHFPLLDEPVALAAIDDFLASLN